MNFTTVSGIFIFKFFFYFCTKIHGITWYIHEQFDISRQQWNYDITMNDLNETVTEIHVILFSFHICRRNSTLE